MENPKPHNASGLREVIHRDWSRRSAVVAILAASFGGGYVWWNRRQPQAATEIFEGATYGCDRLPASEEGSGLLHWVRVALGTPGVELYVTPLDPTAITQGWQYRLRFTEDVVESEHLAVAINATMIRMPGDLARNVETVVADHVVNSGWPAAHLLWFDDQLTRTHPVKAALQV